FFLLLKRLTPEPKINLDFDWFYRRLMVGFMWFDQKFIQAFDSGWGEIYKSVGLKGLMSFAGRTAWFDRWGIDGVVDNVAYGTKGFANEVRSVQSGNIQFYLALAFLIIFVIVGIYWFI
ncbi:MAG TPA: Na+/H+ antiporter subunit D, partial [Thermodesulfobacteriota bacterium]|nr:Na+/H+ antiporter subunit D [Thermodesulfobacteriota bacterium]